MNVCAVLRSLVAGLRDERDELRDERDKRRALVAEILDWRADHQASQDSRLAAARRAERARKHEPARKKGC